MICGQSKYLPFSLPLPLLSHINLKILVLISPSANKLSNVLYIQSWAETPSLFFSESNVLFPQEMSSHTEDQKKQIYDGLSTEQKGKQSYTEWVKEAYNDRYEKWMPWLEDKYLALFGKDNKASYVTKGMFVPPKFKFFFSSPCPAWV
jgi:hypothetical protein